MSWMAMPCGRRPDIPAGLSERLTLPQFVADFGQQFGFGRARRRVGAALHAVGGADKQEDDEGEDQEVDHDGDELADADYRDAGRFQVGVAVWVALEAFRDRAEHA